MPGVRVPAGIDVFSLAIDRMKKVYEEGHRVVVSFSAGKDSGVCLEICRIAATETGRLPVEVLMRDEEIMFPGTYEYAERIAADPEIDFHWIYAEQPVLNVFNRAAPYFWVFDPTLDPDEWVRKPPDYAYKIEDKNIQAMVTPERFPPAPGKDLFAVVGLRTAESPNRAMGLFSSKGYLTKPNARGCRLARPIYDWVDGDVWKAINDGGWDYNTAYNSMHRLGLPASQLRIAPPTMAARAMDQLVVARKAWPQWFERVSNRLPGIRTAANFGRRAIEPRRNLGETWQETFERECVSAAPAWIAERAAKVASAAMRQHARHSTQPLPEKDPCYQCAGKTGAWRILVRNMYGGDPFAMKHSALKYVEPEFFREGAGIWGGSPSF
tara:strand:+ start:1230 stop:2375 length:1146 start_codon:yes stop_codon:yes gene_type:complete